MGKIQKLKEQRKIERTLKEESKKKKRKKIILISLISLVLLAIIITGAIYILGQNKEKSTIQAIIKTNKGDIRLDLDKDAAPNTVDNFIKLAKEEFYNGIKFHRVESGFVIQAGDPLTKDDDPANDGSGGPGYAFDDEINPKALGLDDTKIKALESQGYKFNYFLKSISHTIGTISMANSGPNTNGSQFFITLTDLSDLDGRYTVFGRVVEGMDVVQEIKVGDIINKVEIKQ